MGIPIGNGFRPLQVLKQITNGIPDFDLACAKMLT
jgi:hypothetical protein